MRDPTGPAPHGPPLRHLVPAPADRGGRCYLGRMAPRTRRRLALTLVVAGVVWAWETPLVLPLKLLVVWFHELGHAAAALATGGQVVELVVRPDQGGHTLTRGGWPLVVLSGGYLGSLVAGVLLLVAVRRERAARVVAALLGALLVGVALAWMPLPSFGQAFALATGAAFLGLARWGRPRHAAWALRVVGVVSVLYALVDLRTDVLGAPGGAVTDATLLRDRTGVPAVAWGIIWTLAGLGLLWRTRRWIA